VNGSFSSTTALTKNSRKKDQAPDRVTWKQIPMSPVGTVTPRAQASLPETSRAGGRGVVKALYVVSRTGIKDNREWAPSAVEALRLVLDHMKLRRPGVRVEDERGNPVSFFQLKEMAERERATKPRRS
jgi:hypothetical protein